ncbi:MAG: urease accessory UreF family protein [Chthoniobacterales bacterium]
MPQDSLELVNFRTDFERPDTSQSAFTRLQHINRYARQICPAWKTLHSPTFSAKNSIDAAWFQWREQTFHPILYPALQEATQFARSGKIRELCELDQKISTSLHPAQRLQSSTQGHHHAKHSAPPRAEKTAIKFYTAVRQGDTPGNYLIFHALRGAIFHLSDQLILATYLFLEVRSHCHGESESYTQTLIDRQLAAPKEKPQLKTVAI